MKRVLPILLTILLTACIVDPPKTFEPAPMNFAANGPINVNVAEIQVITNYKAPLRRPNVEQEFPTPPEGAVKQWVSQRLHAVGQQGVLEISIDDASVKEVPLPRTKGIKGVFTNDQAARYDASLKVTAKLYNGVDAMSAAQADVSVTRSKSIAEHSSVDDRMKLYDGMTRDMMATFDSQMTQRFHAYFGNYLK